MYFNLPHTKLKLQTDKKLIIFSKVIISPNVSLINYFLNAHGRFPNC